MFYRVEVQCRRAPGIMQPCASRHVNYRLPIFSVRRTRDSLIIPSRCSLSPGSEDFGTCIGALRRKLVRTRLFGWTPETWDPTSGRGLEVRR